MARYRVLIPYTEPTFSPRLGRPADHVYMGEEIVDADGAEAAKGIALGKFHARANASGVGWARLPLESRISVELLDSAGA